MSDIDEIKARYITCKCIENRQRAEAAEAREKALREAASLAYGYLWHMAIDKTTLDGQQKSRARAALSPSLSDAERSQGIYAANTALGDHYKADALATDQPEKGESDDWWG